MLTVDLEKKMTKENRQTVTPEELLVIREYDQHANLLDNEAMNRVGLNKNIVAGKSVKESAYRKKQMTEKYNQEKVFHISQIESICKKYYLKFLEADRYEGTIDDQLPTKISNFEAAYGDQCDSRNTFIAAPVRSFRLEEKPKDPLMFYRINDEYYYLIHKWGNDLSVFRRILSILSNSVWSFILIAFIFPLVFLLIPHDLGVIMWIASSIVSLTVILSNNSTVGWSVDSNRGFGSPATIIRPNRWDSPYRYSS
jgi:hypothetical protein